MPDTSRIAVGTAAGTLIAANTQVWEQSGRRMERHFQIQHAGAAGTVFLGGGSTVGTATGYPYVSTAGAAFSVTLDPGETIYAIANFVGGTVAVFGEGN
jgi:hypothetical protein